MTTFGQLKRLELRSVWAKEATAFTPWLAANIQELGKALGIDLELVAREVSVGDFSLDLLAKDLGSNRTVIIENQLTPTNHDHLGKLLTYAAGYDAAVIVWIAESIREEHRQALDWLNQRTDSETTFFGIIVEVLQIDDSKPAYNFKPIVFPNEWQKTQHKVKTGNISARSEAYRNYFQQLIDELRERHKFTGARVGQPQSWYSFSSGFSGIYYTSSFAQGERVRVEVTLSQGDGAKNKLLFDWLESDKEAVEKEFGAALQWERLDNRAACRIAAYRSGTIGSDSNSLQSFREWTIEQLLKLKIVFGKRLKNYYESVIGSNAGGYPT